MIRPLRDLLLVRLLEPEEQAGSIYLPDEARNDSCRDGLVLATGLDVAAGGVQVGDRAVFLRHHVRAWVEPEPPKVLVDGEWFTDYVFLWAWAQSRGWKFCRTHDGYASWNQDEVAYLSPWVMRGEEVLDFWIWTNEQLEAAILQEWSRSRFCLVSDADLVAVIPGPDHSELRAANDYVLIEADRVQQYTERPSGIIQAGHSLAGAKGRMLQRGKELLDQAVALVRTPRFLEAVEYDRWRMRKDWYDALSPSDKEAFVDATRDNGEAGEHWRSWVPIVRYTAPVTGTLVDAGPAAKLMMEWHRGEPVPGNPMRVAWDKQHVGAELFSGHRKLLALRAEDISAVLGEEAAVAA